MRFLCYRCLVCSSAGYSLPIVCPPAYSLMSKTTSNESKHLGLELGSSLSARLATKYVCICDCLPLENYPFRYILVNKVGKAIRRRNCYQVGITVDKTNYLRLVNRQHLHLFIGRITGA